jgi:hypothetical protein
MHVFLVIRLNAFSLLTVKCIWLLGHSQSNKCDPPIHLLLFLLTDNHLAFGEKLLIISVFYIYIDIL